MRFHCIICSHFHRKGKHVVASLPTSAAAVTCCSIARSYERDEGGEFRCPPVPCPQLVFASGLIHCANKYASSISASCDASCSQGCANVEMVERDPGRGSSTGVSLSSLASLPSPLFFTERWPVAHCLTHHLHHFTYTDLTMAIGSTEYKLTPTAVPHSLRYYYRSHSRVCSRLCPSNQHAHGRWRPERR